MILKRSLGIFVFLLLTVSPAGAHEHHSSMVSEKSKPLGDSIFNLKSKWTDQNGQAMGLDFLKGQRSVVTMAYTSCQASCPLIIEQMKKIQAALPAAAKDQIRFAFFSFDSKKDTPEQLKKFAVNRKLDLKTWTLLNGDSRAVRELAAVLVIRYKQDAHGDFDHSNIISVLDADGVVRFQQTGFDQKSEEVVKELMKVAK